MQRFSYIEMKYGLVGVVRSWGLGALAVLALMTGAASAHGDVAFLMEEPYGGFGSVNPTGHGALYFNHICAESPTRLRVCRPTRLQRR